MGASRRRLMLLGLGALVPPLLPAAVAPAPPATAAECISEVPPGLFDPKCDDLAPPETTLIKVTPAPNGGGWTDQADVSFTFSGAYDDADTDPIAYECQLYAADAPPSAWESCTSPASYDDLAETGDGPLHTFRVRAVDAADVAIDARNCTVLGCTGTDTPDLDQTPVTVSFGVDTIAPGTNVFTEGLHDEITPDFPLLRTARLRARLSSNEDHVRFQCRTDVWRACGTGGETWIGNLRPGDQTIQVRATDRAGNSDPNPYELSVAVPKDLRPPAGWRNVTGDGYFGGDVLQTRTVGETVKVRINEAQDVRVLAPTGPKQAVIQYRLGPHRDWVKLDQQTSRVRKLHPFVIGWFQHGFVGEITFRVKKVPSGTSARIDAILAH